MQVSVLGAIGSEFVLHAAHFTRVYLTGRCCYFAATKMQRSVVVPGEHHVTVEAPPCFLGSHRVKGFGVYLGSAIRASISARIRISSSRVRQSRKAARAFLRTAQSGKAKARWMSSLRRARTRA